MKKFISILLLLTMMLSLFAGCAKEEPKADTAGLDAAKKYVQTSYINDEATTAMDYKMPGVAIVSVEGEKKEFKVEWSTNSDKITCTLGDDKFVTIKVPTDNLEDINYTLTATISDADGNKQTVSFERVVPARAGIPTEVKDGTYVIVYDNLTFSSLAEDKGYGYAPATQVTVADGAVTGYTAADVITIENVDGGFTMKDAYGRYIYLKGTFNSFNVGTELSEETMAVWQLLTGKEGKQFIVNAGTMKTLAYDTAYTSWGAYPEISGTRMSTVSVIAATAPEGGEPGTEDPGTEDPGTEDPGTETPGTDTPGTEDPGTETPGTDKPSSLDDQIKAALALADQEQLSYTSTMTGKITKINEEYSEQYKNITVTIEYKGKSYKMYRLKGDKAADLKVGDTITVTGNLKKWYDDVEMVNGKLDKVVAGTGSSTEKPADKPSTPAGTPATVKDGTYVIYVPAYNKALSSEKALNKDGSVGFYNAGVDVTVSGSTVSGVGETEKWVIKNNADGTITISQNGKNLALADSYSSMNLGEVNDKWIVEDAGNGMIYIKNAVRGNYIEWYADMNNWSSYGTIGEGKEGLFAIKLIEV